MTNIVSYCWVGRSLRCRRDLLETYVEPHSRRFGCYEEVIG